MKRLNLLLPVFVLMLLVIFILPFYSAAGYSLINNTTSQLGAQATPNAWIMNLVFILLGLSCIIEGWLRLKGYWFQKIVLLIFGLTLIGTAIFRHQPITPKTPFNIFADEWHSHLASLTGFSFTILAISAAFIETGPWRKVLAVAAGLWATFLSLLFFLDPSYAGVWQRLIFISSFAWLLVFFERQKN